MRVEERGEPRDVVVAVLEERVVRPARELVDADVGDLPPRVDARFRDEVVLAARSSTLATTQCSIAP